MSEPVALAVVQVALFLVAAALLVAAQRSAR